MVAQASACDAASCVGGEGRPHRAKPVPPSCPTQVHEMSAVLQSLYPVALSPKLLIALPPLFPPWCVGGGKDAYSEEKLLTRRMES
jgi:hypothetical protein